LVTYLTYINLALNFMLGCLHCSLFSLMAPSSNSLGLHFSSPCIMDSFFLFLLDLHASVTARPTMQNSRNPPRSVHRKFRRPARLMTSQFIPSCDTYLQQSKLCMGLPSDTDATTTIGTPTSASTLHSTHHSVLCYVATSSCTQVIAPVVPSSQLVYAASPPVLIVKSSIQIANTRPAAVLRFVLAPPSLDSPSMPFSDLHKSNVLTLASISDILCRHAHIFFVGSTYHFDVHSIALCCQHHQLSTFICTPLFGDPQLSPLTVSSKLDSIRLSRILSTVYRPSLIHI